MRIFVIHRSEDGATARRLLRKSAQHMRTRLRLLIIDSAAQAQWRRLALHAIARAEAAVIYDSASCEASENAKWEIDQARRYGLPRVEISPQDTPVEVSAKLLPLYDFAEEFSQCFKGAGAPGLMELYKMMVESSESLVARRQKTNAFFITAIGSLMAIAGVLAECGALNSRTIWLLYGFAVAGILLCISWRNLIGNYGKLNKAKFDVILELEQRLPARMFAAEWIALGKGLRPRKYRSFTSTEKHVPLYFGLLLIALAALTVVYQIWRHRVA